MCSLQDEYNWFRSGSWSDPDPKVCLCHGRGYALSDVDTWHECRYHFVKGQHHPEDECDCGETPCAHYKAAPPPAPAPAPVLGYSDNYSDEIPF